MNAILFEVITFEDNQSTREGLEKLAMPREQIKQIPMKDGTSTVVLLLSKFQKEC